QVGADAFQHPLLSGAAQYLVDIVMKQMNVRARFDKPGDLQRMASNSISRTDREEAYLVGQMGVRALLSGEHDKMVTLVRQTEPEYHCTTDLVSLERVANEQRIMPEAYLNQDKTMVTAAFYDYALPLIGDPLPRHAALATTRIISL
ncbi:MAG TPA: 6-phosphofructokinase, partial [Ktedonobacteraceae bacterium]|nr:6-phosphofructokinase [Ktedonobacteraceae bacterium]